MIEAVYDDDANAGAGAILLISSGEHQRVGHVFAHNGHLRDKWYHAPVIEAEHGAEIEHAGFKVMDITDDWRDVVKLFDEEGAMSLVDKIIDAANEYFLMHLVVNPPATGEPVSGEIVFG